MSAWDLFGLHPHLVSVLEEQFGFEHPTDVQSEFLKFTNSRQDILVASRTGSGKTFCYLLPILNSVLHRFDKLNSGAAQPEDEQNGDGKKRQSNYMEGLIFVPTRDLAVQVYREAKKFLSGPYASIHLCLIIGGMFREKQLRTLGQSPAIVISTPGRLWDFMENEKAPAIRKLAGVKFLVLDEIDRIIELGQFKELTQILNFVYSEALNEQELLRQTALDSQEKEFVEFNGEKIEVLKENQFETGEILTEKEIENLKKRAAMRRTFVISATLTKISSTSRMLSNKKFQKTIKEWKKKQKEGGATDDVHPKVLDIMAKLKTNKDFKVIDLVKDELKFLPASVTIQKIKSPTDDKIYYLYHVLRTQTSGLSIVFVNSINAVRKVKNVLEFLKVECVNLHSKMRQVQRIDRLEKFEGQKRRCLVTTDVGARGLDIKDVELVIHYHTPRDMDTFVHRCGRTARGTASGRVLIISDPDDQKRLNKYVHDLPKDCIHMLELPIKEVFADKKLVDEALDIERQTHSKNREKKEETWIKKTADEIGFDPDFDEFTEKGKQKRRMDDEDDDRAIREKKLRQKQEEFASRRKEFEGLYDKQRNRPYGRYSSFLDSDDVARIAGSLKRVKN